MLKITEEVTVNCNMELGKIIEEVIVQYYTNNLAPNQIIKVYSYEEYQGNAFAEFQGENQNNFANLLKGLPDIEIYEKSADEHLKLIKIVEVKTMSADKLLYSTNEIDETEIFFSDNQPVVTKKNANIKRFSNPKALALKDPKYYKLINYVRQVEMYAYARNNLPSFIKKHSTVDDYEVFMFFIPTEFYNKILIENLPDKKHSPEFIQYKNSICEKTAQLLTNPEHCKIFSFKYKQRENIITEDINVVSE
jgi:hypothetical protein